MDSLFKNIISIAPVLLLVFLFSCQKGNEPVPYSDGLNSTSFEDAASHKIGDTDGDDEYSKGGSEDSSDDGSGSTGGSVIGGDDNEDDDDSGIVGGDDNEDDDDASGKNPANDDGSGTDNGTKGSGFLGGGF